MKYGDRIIVIETKIKYIEKTMYAILAILVSQVGYGVIV